MAGAIAAVPERLPSVAAFDPAGQAKNAMAVIDAGPSWPDFGEVTGWSELPNAGEQLHTRLDRLLPRAVLPRHHGDHGARWSAAT